MAPVVAQVELLEVTVATVVPPSLTTIEAPAIWMPSQPYTRNRAVPVVQPDPQQQRVMNMGWDSPGRDQTEGNEGNEGGENKRIAIQFFDGFLRLLAAAKN